MHILADQSIIIMIFWIDALLMENNRKRKVVKHLDSNFPSRKIGVSNLFYIIYFSINFSHTHLIIKIKMSNCINW